VSVDIRGTDNAGILRRLQQAVEGILKPSEAPADPATSRKPHVGSRVANNGG